MRLDGGLTDSEQLELDRFELELRKLMSVVAVGFEGAAPDHPIGPEDVLSVHVLIADPAIRPTVEQQAIDLGRLHHARPLRIVVSVEGEEPGTGLDPAASAVAVAVPLSRVRVTSIDPAAASGTEVTLAHGEVTATGRGASGTPSGAASATIAALRQLGWSIPFDVESAVRLAMGTTGAVLVHLVGKEGERLGVSPGATAEDAAVKATLQALNRWLDDPGRRPMSLRPASDRS